ncbi:MAG TPA: FixH family protein [Cyclobacteriaceae bacterium]|nr:FixH family protein [Cyclobacteriaceae bacterium]HRJ82819.1 FixH family protein [Cyclobacteriaceae bacterium]
MNWGKGIVVAFILFAAFLAVMITIMMKQDIGLVSKNYYAEDLAFQEQFERKQNTEQLEFKPEITIEQKQYLKVYFPSVSFVEEGEVKLFRPSSDKLDQQIRLHASADSVQVFPLQPLEHGAYRVKMKWTTEGKEYYLEKVIFI